MADKRTIIGENTYLIGELDHIKAREVFFILLRNFGPGMSEAIARGALTALDGPALGRALHDMCLRLNAQDAETVSQYFGEVCSVLKATKVDLGDGKRRNAHFKGALAEWLKWLRECVEHNYADFLELLASVKNSPSEEPEQPEADPEA